MNPRVTISMPSYMRPKRTIRAIECIVNQNINGWEALVTGDGCPVMADFIKSGTFDDMVLDAERNGNQLIIKNNPINQGHHGYAITNEHIQRATGKYFVFYANDDMIFFNHLHNYLGEIENTDLDFTYFDSFVQCNNQKRISQLKFGHIGHSELIIRTEFLKQMPPHDQNYGHDFSLIENMMSATNKYRKANTTYPSYHVMSLPNNQEKNID